MAETHDIVALTSGGPHSWIMINALRERFGDFPVILEQPECQKSFWKRRLKMLGPIKVASMQAARLPMKFTKLGSENVITDMIGAYRLFPKPIQGTRIIDVPSVNTKACRDVLADVAPKAVFVVSTRMIGRKTLNAVDAPFINYHSGINPAYRGMFGGYFALANGEPEHFGATVHLIDEGVDTGGILYQSKVDAHPSDTFHTYLWRIAAGSRDIVVQAMEDAVDGRLAPHTVNLPSRQWFAPTLGGYVWTGLSRGVW
ncbi:MAG: formyl transferase [Henriciella sp.]|uniref:formyl transferase n=1 Tax=Henriciella sp. TaxID=1968823 RepID=UPI003C757C80